MYTVKEIQEQIFNETGIKTSVKHMTGSMKHHLCFTSMKIKGERKDFDFIWRKEFLSKFKIIPGIYGNYHSNGQLEILKLNFSDTEPINYKPGKQVISTKEDKTVSIESFQSTTREQRRQIRLDKACARYGKRVRGGANCATYL